MNETLEILIPIYFLLSKVATHVLQNHRVKLIRVTICRIYLISGQSINV